MISRQATVAAYLLHYSASWTARPRYNCEFCVKQKPADSAPKEFVRAKVRLDAWTHLHLS